MIKDYQLVSIVIPVYNRGSLLEDTIKSAISQTYSNLEIIIYDNCSTDNTWDVMEKYQRQDSRILLFRHLENVGPVLNWKACIEKASGNYIKILFSDDLISENFISETISCFDDNTAFVLSKNVIFNAEKTIESNNYLGSIEISVEKYLRNVLLRDRYGFPVSPGSAIFRKEDLLIGLEIDIPNPIGLDFKRFGAGNDLLLFLNIAKYYSVIKISQTAIAYFRAHSESFTISNKLVDYYDYAKLYYINNNKVSYISKFKTILWLRKIRCRMMSPVLTELEVNINFWFLIKIVIFRLFDSVRKVRKRWR